MLTHYRTGTFIGVYLGDVKMVCFGSSGDVEMVWFCHSGDVKRFGFDTREVSR